MITVICFDIVPGPALAWQARPIAADPAVLDQDIDDPAFAPEADGTPVHSGKIADLVVALETADCDSAVIIVGVDIVSKLQAIARRCESAYPEIHPRLVAVVDNCAISAVPDVVANDNTAAKLGAMYRAFRRGPAVQPGVDILLGAARPQTTSPTTPIVRSETTAAATPSNERREVVASDAQRHERAAAEQKCGPKVRISGEQALIALAGGAGLNVLVRAVAGAGKTTTLILLYLWASAQAQPRVYSGEILTYNKRLQVDVERRIKALTDAGVKSAASLRVSTYHAAAGRAYERIVRNDEMLKLAIRAPPTNPPRFDLLMVDEAQDMTPEFFAFVRYLLRANPKARVIVVGDELQAINEYRGARPEFLTQAADLYGGQWVELRLRTSYRLTPANAEFINTHMYRAPIVVGGNTRAENTLPYYCIGSGFAGYKNALFGAVDWALAQYPPDGIFVLMASTRNLNSSKAPGGELVRRLTHRGVLLYINSDESPVDADQLKGKLAVLSFNSVKGCEADCVIVCGCDESYFEYYNKEWTAPMALPNILTVAATRAKRQLIIVADSARTIRTIDMSRLEATASLRYPPDSGKAKRGRGYKLEIQPPRAHLPKIPTMREVGVTDLVRHLHPSVVSSTLALLEVGAPEPTGITPARHAHTKVRFEYGTVTPGDNAATATGSAAAGPASATTTATATAKKAKGKKGEPKPGHHYEDVSFIYGTLATVLAEVQSRGDSDFARGLSCPVVVRRPTPMSNEITAAAYRSYPPGFWESVRNAETVPPRDRAVADWCRLAVAREAMWVGRHHIARQISNYEWVDAAAFEQGAAAVRAAVDKFYAQVCVGAADQKFSVLYEHRLPQFTHNSTRVSGVADVAILAGDFVVKLLEIKYSPILTEEHTLQLACYLAMLGGGEGYLFSITSAQARRVYVPATNAARVLKLIIDRTPPEVKPVQVLVAELDCLEAGIALSDDEDAIGGEAAAPDFGESAITAADIYM